MDFLKKIKSRFAKLSNRGIYIQDRELLDTNFNVGEHFVYEFDMNLKQLIIKPSAEGKNTVSKRQLKMVTKPVIDIRDREVLKGFKGHDKLEIEIFEDLIVVRGISEKVVDIASKYKGESTSKSKGKSIFKSFLSKVIPFRASNSKKTVWETYLSKDSLFSSDAVGFSSFASVTSAIEDFSSSTNFKKPEELAISLEVASLFSGFGGLDTGFINNGFTIKFANDIMKGACETYRHNIGDHIVHQDILELDLDTIPKTPIMIFGSSCKPFSNANRSKTRLDNHKDYQLFSRTIEAVEQNPECKIFVWENVPGMIKSKGVLEEICERLSDFEISYAVLNSADYGTAMLRKRVIIVGSKIGKFEFPAAYLDKDNYNIVYDCLKDISPDLPNAFDRSKSSAHNVKRMAMIPPGGNWKALPMELRNPAMKKDTHSDGKSKELSTSDADKGKKTHSNYLKKLDPLQPSISLANTRKSLVSSPLTNLGITVREAARIFGVRDDFEFKGILSERQEQITNSVPIRFAEAIAKKVRVLIEQFNWRLALQHR